MSDSVPINGAATQIIAARTRAREQYRPVDDRVAQRPFKRLARCRIGLQRGRQLPSRQTSAPVAQRQALKWALTRRLFERGYGKQDVLELFRLIDWLLVLPQDLAVAFRQQVVQYSEQKVMPYVNSIERLAREEGMQQGKVQNAQEAVLEVLEARFGAAPYAVREKLQAIQDAARLKELLRSATVIPSMEAFQKGLL